MRRSHTAVVERDILWAGPFETEPYEGAWATEAIFFVRSVETSGPLAGPRARVQISPDGMHWCDEGSEVSLPAEPGLTIARVSHFGAFLRLAGELPDGAEATVIVYLALKE